ncbi:hypothetical protein Air01nite_07020 [Asanoa iriomotensis]|uniref:Uncharacterized protein n=1 Tax=Asanoa iriomotensis TaxID=234613 RepID=A0ABQ4BVQ4_9ACTN|nr:hypothetical protein Air01nite_07020 [Asanoa iriomotensis]
MPVSTDDSAPEPATPVEAAKPVEEPAAGRRTGGNDQASIGDDYDGYERL